MKPGPGKARSIVVALLDWFQSSARELPWRRTRDPYGIWVSEIMLQQTQVATVVPYWERWMRELPTIQALAKASPARVHKLWEGLGYYSRVRNLQKAAQTVVASHDAKFPSEFQQVLALPGIGRYTAGAICSIAFNQPTPILDGNVIRVLTRLFAIPGNPRAPEINSQLWSLAEKLVRLAATAGKPRSSGKLNESLMELGALICTPRDPDCVHCPVRIHCSARRQDRAAAFPQLPRRRKSVQRRVAAFIVRDGSRVLVRQRPAGGVNAQLWEFPNAELGAGPESAARAAGTLGFTLAESDPVCTIRHSITHHRITLQVYHARALGRPKTNDGQWLTAPELQKLAFPSAHRRLLEFLTS
ncbi:MAG: A/G-specific adenine glycosylase [Verrucomicrobiota bacterium]